MKRWQEQGRTHIPNIGLFVIPQLLGVFGWRGALFVCGLLGVVTFLVWLLVPCETTAHVDAPSKPIPPLAFACPRSGCSASQIWEHLASATQPQPGWLSTLYARFIAWIKQFPPSILIQHPDLANWYASALMMLGQLDKLHAVGETAARGFKAQENLSSLGTMLAFNAIRHYWTGDHAAFTRLREQAVPLLTEHVSEAGLTLTILNGFAAFQQGQVQTARPLFDTWLRFYEQNLTFTGYMAGCAMCSADIWWLQGQLHKAVPVLR